MEKSIKKKDITEEMLDTINFVDKELTEVFYELMSGNISLKKRMLLRDKTLLLIRKAYESLIFGVDKTEKDLKDIEEIEEKSKKMAFIALIIRFIGILLLFKNPYLSLTAQFVGIGMNHYASKKLHEARDREPDYSVELVNKANSLNILIGNCSRRLSLDVDIYTEKESDELFDKMDIANNIINEYVKSNVIPQEIDDITKEILIKMLQKDLKIDSNNMNYLLEEASKKIKEEEKKENISKRLTS